MADRIAIVGDDGKLPAAIAPTGTEVSNGDGAITVDTEGAIEMIAPVNADWTGWTARRSYGDIDKSVTPIWNVMEGTLENKGMFVSHGPASGRTWGGHVFHGWDPSDTYRLTLLIGINSASEGSLQTWNPATSEFGTVRIGSDFGGQGTVFERYEVTFSGNIQMAGGIGGRENQYIARTNSGGTLTIYGGAKSSSNTGSYIQVRGGSVETNPAGTIVNFGCNWKQEADLASTFAAINYQSATRNVDMLKVYQSGQVEITTGDLRITTPKTPASASATGAAGEVCWDADYLYVCTATDTWKRTALSTWT